MPARDTGLGIAFTNHWIRVRSDLEGTGKKAPALDTRPTPGSLP
jgi:hypothetical protein